MSWADANAPQTHPDYIPPEKAVSTDNNSSGHKPASAPALIILSEQE